MKYYVLTTFLLFQVDSAFGMPDTFYDRVQAVKVSVSRLDVFNILSPLLKIENIDDVSVGPIVGQCALAEMCVNIDIVEKCIEMQCYVSISATAYRRNRSARHFHLSVSRLPEARLEKELFTDLVRSLAVLIEESKEQKK